MFFKVSTILIITAFCCIMISQARPPPDCPTGKSDEFNDECCAIKGESSRKADAGAELGPRPEPVPVELDDVKIEPAPKRTRRPTPAPEETDAAYRNMRQAGGMNKKQCWVNQGNFFKADCDKICTAAGHGSANAKFTPEELAKMIPGREAQCWNEDKQERFLYEVDCAVLCADIDKYAITEGTLL